MHLPYSHFLGSVFNATWMIKRIVKGPQSNVCTRYDVSFPNSPNVSGVIIPGSVIPSPVMTMSTVAANRA